MTEPRRLLEQDATATERALLRSAHADGPPADAAQRLRLAIEGLGVAGVGPSGQGAPGHGPAPSAPVAAPALELGALAKLGLAALIGALVVGGGALVHHLTVASQRAVPAGGTPATPATAKQEQAPTSPASAASAAPAPAVTTPDDDSLTAELRLLDATRVALVARDTAGAQRALESYTRRFPHGRLEPEAAVLRLAVLVRQRDQAAARSLANQLLGNENYKTYQARIRSLLREAER
jgi:hypothetical protein